MERREENPREGAESQSVNLPRGKLADTPPDAEWEYGWEGHSEAKRQRLARLSMAEKLAWLEEAHRIVRHLCDARQDRRRSPDEPDRI